MTNDILTQEQLKEKLHYCPLSGIFTWNISPSNNVNPGDVCKSKAVSGYRIVSINSKSYLQHRLAWLYMTGRWPVNFIDHINRIPDDNRWNNLREASQKENCMNITLSIKNTSGFKGVHLSKKKNIWVATVSINNKTKFIGSSKDLQKVIKMREYYVKNLHGEFYTDGN